MMNRRFPRVAAALLMVALVAPMALFAAGAQEAAGATETAEPVQYGDLRLGLVDANGDLVADTPADEADWVDPSVLVFAYTPVEDPEVYRDVWAEFLAHMEEVTGKTVQFFPVQSNAAQHEAMRAGRLHVAGFNTGSNPLAVNCSGFVPFAMMAGEDGSFGYEMGDYHPGPTRISRRSKTFGDGPSPSPPPHRTPVSRRRAPS
jgi:phosphonate transport system substrate-binding protein